MVSNKFRFWFAFRVGILSATLLGFSHSIFAQYTLRGQTLGMERNEPLPLATIYLNNTTLGTSSDVDGNFSLNIPSGSYELVISYTGYKTIVYRLPPEAPDSPLIFKLEPEEIELDEISVSSERDPSWFTNVKIFKKHFIGESSEARKTIIENEDKIIIDHLKAEKQLQAFANEPLVILNEALGYRLEYELENFFFDFEEDLVSYAGYPFFQELEGNARQKRRWARARQDTYEGSFMHFARILIAGGNPNDHGFEVRPVKPNYKIQDNIPATAENPTSQEVTIDSLLQPYHYFIETNENRYFILFKDKIEVVYNKKRADYYYRVGSKFRAGGLRVSKINLQMESAELDINGSLINPLAAIFEGYWGWEKIGNILPVDYQSETSN